MGMGNNGLLTWFIAFLCVHDVCGYTLTILHTNDVHSRIQEFNKHGSPCSPSTAAKGKCYGGQERLKHKNLVSSMDQMRSECVWMKDKGWGGRNACVCPAIPIHVRELREEFPNTILLDAGNQYQGTLFFFVYGGQILSQFMNILGYDAMALGNHEFDNEPAGLWSFLKNATFPILACNIDVTREHGLESIHKSVVLRVGGQAIGIIGYMPPYTRVRSKPGNVRFADEIGVIQTEVDELTKKGVNKIIALGSSGYDKDLEIAAKVSGLDVIVGGNSKTFLYTGHAPDREEPLGNYPTVVKTKGNENVLVVQAFAYAKYLGVLHITFDESGLPKPWNGNPVLLNDSVPKDGSVTAVIRKYLPEVENRRNERVGVSFVHLDGERSTCWVKECNTGNFISDAIWRQTMRNTKAYVDMVLFGGGGIRSSISRGNIMLSNIMELTPFQNTIDRVELKGNVILDILEHGASMWRPNTDSGAFLQVAGLQVIYDMRRKRGRRVRRVMIWCNDCIIQQFTPLDMSKRYIVITTSFLVSGGDGYAMIKGNMGKSHIPGQLDYLILLDYLRENPQVISGLDGRIQFLQDLEENQFCSGTAYVGKIPILLMMTGLNVMIIMSAK